jgi:hypothetical protein
MTIEQHAEAAANEIDRSATDGPKAIIAKHMQSAIDETTIGHAAMIAKYTERIDELETLNNGYRLRCHTAEMSAAGSKEAIEQWRELDTVLRGRLDKAKARIAKLEGLGPLIEEYASERMRQAEAEAIDEWGDRKMFENRADRAKAKITAILKGES